jgi:hypothetical protein
MVAATAPGAGAIDTTLVDFNTVSSSITLTSVTSGQEGWKSMFSNANGNLYPEGCGIEDCQLYEAGACGTTPLALPFSGYFAMTDTTLGSSPLW